MDECLEHPYLKQVRQAASHENTAKAEVQLGADKAELQNNNGGGDNEADYQILR